ncbi:response regulator [Sulfurirhabdus autotrophica]|uniref:Response regulator receiver domain-containing protein n=2 Tax=Sulfurirhabdus autotrophica TaxID=1706046 RepID=A0A4R3YCC0_9PROT|nr:response regulator [Sulfurirhabdus autotrophica]TCV89656.1 response regulator receiver domain-containing protein [Sulfurirhabdus autotrophica]
MERTLLLVDDEENIASALVRLLRRDGYQILRASSGKEGLELLSKNNVGVIISDQRMPEMTGVEFLSKVKELYPDTVRIVLSGYTDLNSVTDAINRGAIYKFLTKPWEDELLRANVEEAFRRYEMKIENIRLTLQLREANEALSKINHELEQRVEDKTREIVRNMHILQISQDILDFLPVAVLGIGDDGLIAIANQMAHKMFGGNGERPLLGEMASEMIPAELLANATTKECFKQTGKKQLSLSGGQDVNYWCYSMGELSHAKGVVLVIDPVS